ncbi:MAG: nucleoside transporter C-terminal domain-containing protein [Planctomycetota bacterium]
MTVLILRGLLGVAVLLGVAWLLSTDRKRVPWRVIGWGMGLQLGLAVVLLGTGAGDQVLASVAKGVQEFVSVNTFGAGMLFNDLADPARELPGLPGVPGAGFLFAFAATGLLVIIFFSALMSILYNLGIMQLLIWCLARVMMVTMGVSGAEAMAMAANLFVGQTESPLVVKPYIEKMTLSELNAMMTGGFATVAGSVLVVYLGYLGPEIGVHLLTASVLSAPAAFVIAKIIVPETQAAATAGHVELKIKREAHNLIEAATNGTQDGLKLYLNVIAMLLAFTALVQLVNWPLGEIGAVVFDGMALPTVDAATGQVTDAGNPLSLAKIFGWVLAPLAWCIGVGNWADCQLFGSLIGLKLTTNEFVAFGQMLEYVKPVAEGVAADAGGLRFASERSAKMAAYALCGFANFASIGIQIGGISPLAPGRKTDLSRLALRAMLGGALASACTAAVAGMFL